MLKYWFGVVLVYCCLLNMSVDARRLTGMQGGRQITFDTVLLSSGEYVNTKELLTHFPNSYNYDALAGVIHFYRSDGALIGVMAGDNRVVMNKTIHHTRDRSVRQDGTIYIPLEAVGTFLFPQVQFKPTADDTDTTTKSPTGTPQQFTYGAATPEPEEEGPFGVFPTSTPVIGFEPEVAVSPVSLIILDPGNDPHNPGAGIALRSFEEDVTLLLCEKLKKALEETPTFDVELTRTRADQNAVTNMQRTGIANAKNAAVFVSIQCGALYTKTHSRASVFFMNTILDHQVPVMAGMANPLRISWQTAYQSSQNQSYDFAQTVINELNPYFKLANIIQLDENPRPGRMAVLRGLTMPGIVIELGNLNHAATARHLLRERTMDDLVYKLEQAISIYLYTRSGLQQAGQ